MWSFWFLQKGPHPGISLDNSSSIINNALLCVNNSSIWFKAKKKTVSAMLIMDHGDGEVVWGPKQWFEYIRMVLTDWGYTLTSQLSTHLCQIWVWILGRLALRHRLFPWKTISHCQPGKQPLSNDIFGWSWLPLKEFSPCEFQTKETRNGLETPGGQDKKGPPFRTWVFYKTYSSFMKRCCCNVPIFRIFQVDLGFQLLWRRHSWTVRCPS